MWIFAGAPWLDAIAARPRLQGALGGVTAAVVGVILNLSLWFGLHVLFGQSFGLGLGPFDPLVPVLASIDPRAFALIALAALLLRAAPLPIALAVCALAGWLVA